MPAYTHLVLTRVNVRVDFGGGQIHDADWHHERFNLFETFCLPSLQGQEKARFKWLVFFDRNTPDVFKEKIAVYAQWERFIPYYVDVFRDAKRDAVREQLDPDSTHVITTRVDSDDALSAGYLASVQEQFRSQDCEFIDFPNGYLLLENEGQLYVTRRESNSFMSLIERVDNLRTVYCTGHKQVSTVCPLRSVESEPSWMVVVHGMNSSTRGRKHRLRLAPGSVLDQQFTINYSLPDDAQMRGTV